MDENVFDDWQWHLAGSFPREGAPEQAYIHIGIFVAWLANHDLLATERIRGDWAAEWTALRDRKAAPSALREPTQGQLTAEMLTPDGRAFASAYYAPEYGYARDWQRTFGRQAQTYDVPDGWETYARMEPVLDDRYSEWLHAGKPELMHLPGLIGRLARLFEHRA